MPGADAVLAELVADAVQPALTLGPDGRVAQANARAAEALGYEDARALAGAPAPLALDGVPAGVRVTEVDAFAARDGTAVRVTSVAMPLELPDGPGVVVAFTDVVEADDEALHRAAPPRIASLRRIVTEIAGGMSEMRTYASLAREAARAAALPLLHIVRVEPGGAQVGVVGGWSQRPCKLGAGVRYPLDDVPGAAEMLATRRRTLVDDLTQAPSRAAALLRDEGIFALAWEPVVVGGEVWGAALAGRADAHADPDEGATLAGLAGLLATRVSETADRAELARLLDEQAALRRVATLVAGNAGLDELLATVTREIGLLLDLDLLHLARYDEDGVATGVASWSLRGDPVPLGVLYPDDGESLPSVVRRTGRAVRLADYRAISDVVAERADALALRTFVGAPLFIDGRLWGVLGGASTDDRRLPEDIGERITEFAELVATAISNTEQRAARARLADEQAALRHIATLVARDVGAEELFAEVAATVGRLLDTDFAALARFAGDDQAMPVAAWAADEEDPPLTPRLPLQPGGLLQRIKATGRPARADALSAGTPIVVGGDVWGALIVQTSGDRMLAEDAEERLASFGELVATAISNTEAREQVAALANEQAALRRVATLVAHDAPASEVLAAVGRELGGLIEDAPTEVARYDGDVATVLASWGETVAPAGERLPLEGVNVLALVRDTERPARISAEQWSGPLGEYALGLGLRSAVGAPIIVDGRVWGALTVVSTAPEPLPDDTEQRTARFADLVGAAISNLEARERLAASRARVVAAADDERQRVVRDLHDGAQQRLVHTIITLKLALQGDDERVPRQLVADALEQAERATDELRALARGILPEVLVQGGLPAGVRMLAELAPVPVVTDVVEERVAPPIEATAYFVIAEALTNVAKHARATTAEVRARIDDGALRVEVRDDGVGGARPTGKGLVGLADRLAVHDGRLDVAPREGGGTRVVAVIPLAGSR
jgi:signal transduction histidine kinase